MRKLILLSIVTSFMFCVSCKCKKDTIPSHKPPVENPSAPVKPERNSN
ncbi:hypothetical protein [uncultured Flavobacterium sp.]|nr:hypothetical protein [uncultured Flavobacterium sp.]